MRLPRLVLACVLALAPPAFAQDRATELEGWVRALDAAREPAWSEALERLSARGPEAAARVLADFEQADFGARRARAKLLVQIPEPEACARVLALLGDPDPQVRRLLALWLGNPALAETLASERVAALERLMLADPNDHVRTKAREGLADCALAEAVPVLDRALPVLPPEEAERAAAALAQLPGGRERLIARLAAAPAEASVGSDAPPLPEGVQAALLLGYGRALAEVPGGGEAPRERLPFLRARNHPALVLQAAARASLASFVSRAAELSEAERAERVLALLGGEGWPREECLRRQLDLAWLERGDLPAALGLARALARAAAGLAPEDAEDWELRARMFEGAALYALGQTAEAAQLFGALSARLDASCARRSDLFPFPFPAPLARAWTRGGGAAQIDRQHLAALAHLWLALLALDAEAGGVAVLSELRAAHVLFLESRVVALRTEAIDPTTLDSLLDRDLSPYTLVLFNEHLAPAGRGAALDRALALADAWGQVAPLEMQGLGAKPPPAPIYDVLLDPERFGLLVAMRSAQLAEVERRLGELSDAFLGPRDPDARASQQDLLERYRHFLETSEREERVQLVRARKEAGERALTSDEMRTIHARLLDNLTPSLHAHTLAGELRSEGRSTEARALCERALGVLSTAPLGSSLLSELASARFELLRGSTLMDDGRPADAEQAYQGAERRLAAIEKQVEERAAAAANDAELAQQYAGQVRQIREWRGDALLSLAVNANVGLGDPQRALGFFERAYDLNQSSFMRVLRACYRARSGKRSEALTVLAGVVPVPSLYYNIACTHALLGDTDLALDFLERDLRENHPTPGSRAQKREWALKDPDLSSLRGEARFQRLFGGP
jgi:hypothetical protein